MLEGIKNILKFDLFQKLRIHHSVYRLPCTSEFLEELVSDCLESNGLENDWLPNRSHSVSVDMTLFNDVSISVKSGVYDDKKNTLTFSGSRLGKHKTLPEMIKHIDENSADYYVCLAKKESDWIPVPSKNDIKKYYLFVFDANKLPYNVDAWTTKENGQHLLDHDGVIATIRPSMSYQLWTTVSVDVIGNPIQLDII
jgi:hypothetical protein